MDLLTLCVEESGSLKSLARARGMEMKNERGDGEIFESRLGTNVNAM